MPAVHPYIGADILNHLTGAPDVGWLGMGVTTHKFEQCIGDYLGLDGSAGTSALQVALLGTGAGPGHDMITTVFNDDA